MTPVADVTSVCLCAVFRLSTEGVELLSKFLQVSECVTVLSAQFTDQMYKYWTVMAGGSQSTCEILSLRGRRGSQQMSRCAIVTSVTLETECSRFLTVSGNLVVSLPALTLTSKL